MLRQNHCFILGVDQCYGKVIDFVLGADQCHGKIIDLFKGLISVTVKSLIFSRG